MMLLLESHVVFRLEDPITNLPVVERFALTIKLPKKLTFQEPKLSPASSVTVGFHEIVPVPVQVALELPPKVPYMAMTPPELVKVQLDAPPIIKDLQAAIGVDGTVMVGLPELESIVTSSLLVGTDAPPAPPDVADHLAVLVQLPEPPTQYLYAMI
jgi:hypothetical protein